MFTCEVVVVICRDVVQRLHTRGNAGTRDFDIYVAIHGQAHSINHLRTLIFLATYYHNLQAKTRYPPAAKIVCTR